MTFKEKLAIEHPDCVHDGYIGGCKGCPSDYGYEKGKPCRDIPYFAGDCGKRCWGRHIPKKQSVTFSQDL